MPVAKIFGGTKIVQQIVEVPGETVYVDVPGETVYVDVPGPTVEVPVYVDVPGPTVYVDNILAEFDFANVPDVDLKTNGDYVIPVTGGSTSATTAVLKVFKGQNVGAAGIQRIKDGAIELMPATVTSELGIGYWSALPASMLGINIQSLSSTLSADPLMVDHEYTLTCEIEPYYTNSVVTPFPIYTYIKVGLLTQLNTWDANGTPRPTGTMVGTRGVALGGLNGTELNNHGFQKSSFQEMNFSVNNSSTWPGTASSFIHTGVKFLTAVFDGQTSTYVHDNGIGKVKFSTMPYMNYYTATGSLDNTVNNNLWATILSSRSTGSIQPSNVPWRIKKITILERRQG